LATRDVSYVNYLMNTLNAISCLLWGLYYQLAGATQLALPNYAGVACSILLIPACLYGNKKLQKDHISVRIAEIVVQVIYRIPCQLLAGGAKVAVEETKNGDESKGKKND